MIIGLKQKFALIYGTTIFLVVIFITSLVITVFNFHFSSLKLLNPELMARFRDTFIGIGLIFIPVSAFFSYLVGWIIAQQLHTSKYQITPRAMEAPPLPTVMLEDEFRLKMVTIQNSVEKMREAYDQIQHFSVNASHELRTPLTIIRGEIELALRSTKQPDHYQEILGSLLEEVLRLSRTLDDLLLVAKSQIGQVSMEREKIDLRQFIEEMADEAEMFTSQAGLRFELGTLVDAAIIGDVLRLRRVILNLIENAVKYNTENGTVRVSLVKEREFAVISVTDTGIGIPQEHLGRIFDRFYRVDRDHAESRGGTGLGLYLVQWIVKTHGGDISVSSQPGKGSEFRVYLPLIEY